MSLVQNIINFRDNTSQQAANLAYPPLWLRNAMLGIDYPSASGVAVNENTALKYVAVMACVKLLSEDIAQLPLPIYKRLKVGQQEAFTHPLYSILHDISNNEMTAFQFKQIMVINSLLYSEAYAEIEYDNGGNIIGLWPIPSNKVLIHRDIQTQALSYFVSLPNGGQTVLTPDKMFVLHGMGFDRDAPWKPIEMAREAIGLGLAAERFGASFFGNGSNASGIVEIPSGMNDEQEKRMKQSFQDGYGGLGKSHRLMFLEQGIKFTQLSIAPEAAQFLQTRQHQVEEIARFFRVPLHMIGDLDKATFSNIEQQNLEYVQHTLMPLAVKWEQAIFKDLLSVADRKKYFAKFDFSEFLRADTATRFSLYHNMVNDGIFNADEVRAMENMNPQSDGQGQVYYQNGNMTKKGSTKDTTPTPPKGGEDNGNNTDNT